MADALRRAVRVTLSPAVEWKVIAGETPDPGRILKSFVLPVALIPALSWCVGLLLFNEAPYVEITQIAHRGAVAYAGVLVSIAMLAVCLAALAPLFDIGRNWSRAFQVASYGSAPAMLVGPVLMIPDLAFATLLGVIQSFYLLYVGLVEVAGVKEGQSAEYLALVIVALSVASTLLGAAGSSVGIL